MFIKVTEIQENEQVYYYVNVFKNVKLLESIVFQSIGDYFPVGSACPSFEGKDY